MSFGKKKWAIADGYIPSYSNGPAPQMESHETVCILNTNKTAANVNLMIYFNDKDPVGPFSFIIHGERTEHLRFNNLMNPAPIPKDTDFSCTIESDIPVVVQHTRLDSRQAENALMTTIAYSE